MALDKDKSLILNRIKSHYAFRSDADLGRFLDVASNTLANWRKRNSINLELILTKCDELNATWICCGQGNPTNNYPSLDNEPLSIVEEAVEKIRSAKELEIESLREHLASREAVIAAQAKTMETMQKLIDLQGK